MTLGIILAVLVFVLVVVLLEFGYRMGVKETERRWSEAVTRADAARAAREAGKA